MKLFFPIVCLNEYHFSPIASCGPTLDHNKNARPSLH